MRWTSWVYSVAVLGACATGPITSPPAGPHTILLIGDSISHHAPHVGLGWPPGWDGETPPIPDSWGMAASEASKDYAHLLATTLSASLVIPYDDYDYTVQWVDVVDSLDDYDGVPTVIMVNVAEHFYSSVVTRLGDDDAIDAWLDIVGAFACDQGALPIWLGRYTPHRPSYPNNAWGVPASNARLMAAAEKWGGLFVDISWPVNGKVGPASASTFDNWHPGDVGMQRIHDTIVARWTEEYGAP